MYNKISNALKKENWMKVLILDMWSREISFRELITDKIPQRNKGVSNIDTWGKDILDRWNFKCKSPQIGICLGIFKGQQKFIMNGVGTREPT